ncbi:hypothetical protein Dda_2110 [Drechslerella dactyloides]|uniref:Uncharacterized protein n=1 Tax=Drechslerella dactyloides TaxID=74499 RepID=A0AAD6NL69_DREDA|nr:hypothetical protein Dda_2110 [Drechslerella dactyloides]
MATRVRIPRILDRQPHASVHPLSETPDDSRLPRSTKRHAIPGTRTRTQGQRSGFRRRGSHSSGAAQASARTLAALVAEQTEKATGFPASKPGEPLLHRVEEQEAPTRDPPSENEQML